MENLNIRILTPQDWHKYKSLRLESLEDSPDAFGSTFARESRFSDETWSSRLEPEESDALNLPLMAEINSVPVGLATGRIFPADNKTADIYQMWIKPDSRNLGIAFLLLEKIVTWARTNNMNQVTLSVSTNNVPANKLYCRYGFQPTYEFEPLREGSEIMVNKLVLELAEVAI